jgi:2-C-methyl-D-erythritol 2,4-cyclodiphosphate synthase
MAMRIGFGYDVHRLEAGYDLIIGGVSIPFEKGTVAHSDGDVLIHAICDALLGAVNKGDIGTHFPDTDPRYKGMDSLKILTHTLEFIQQEGYRVVNIDTTVCLQKPRLAPYIERMKQVLGAVISCESISVKATTTERMGFVGEGRGISAYAAILLEK